MKLLKIGFAISTMLAATACSTLNKPFFYEVEKDQKKAYVLGAASNGFGAKELPGYVREKLNSTNAVAIQTSSALNDSGSVLARQFHLSDEWARVKANKNNGTKLSAQLSPQAWAFVQSHLPATKESLALREHLTPLLCYLSLEFKKGERTLFFFSREQLYGWEHEKMQSEIYQTAKAKNEIVAQLDAEKPLTTDCEDKIYLKLIENEARMTPEDHAVSSRRFYDSYKAGDEAALAGAIALGVNAGIDRCESIERNQAWAEQIDAQVSKHDALFISVLVGHVLGDDSLLAQLKAKGYSVKRVDE